MTRVFKVGKALVTGYEGVSCKEVRDDAREI